MAHDTPVPSRRKFLEVASAATLAALAAPRNVHAGAEESLKVGLIGCGGRGTGAAREALRADRQAKLWALADAFADRLALSLESLRQEDVAGQLDVTPERQFVGFDAYRQVIECCDVVLLCTPPHFRPAHLAAAVDAGRHVFAEKPVAVDAPGVRSVLAACEAAKAKRLSICSGLCLRSDWGIRETVKRVHEGAIGQIVALQANDYRSGRWTKPREPEWSDMTYQMRNWYNFTWLSGDFNVEQHVHFLDVCAWLMREEYPVRAIGMGGRQALTGVEYGNIYDHFSITYEYASGAKLFSNCRQQPGCHNDMSAQVQGSRGAADIRERKGGLVIRTEKDTWTYAGPSNDVYQTEHDEFFAAIRSGNPINNGDYMAKSTLLAIMGRMAAYTGQSVTWEAALHSQEDLTPAAYDWHAPLAEPPIAVPGVTRFV